MNTKKFAWTKAAIAFVALITPTLANDAVVVIDGDTLDVGGLRYRLYGIDAPEAGQDCRAASGSKWSCGNAATDHLVLLIGEATPVCDYRGVDEYDRILAVCHVNGRELNHDMIAGGYAWAFRRYSEEYVAIEDDAAAAKLGIWQAPSQTAWDYRAERWDVAVQQAPDGCPIKGNISDNGHIYHAPWSPWYARTKLSEERGERWFCSEREALDAGWRAPIWGH